MSPKPIPTVLLTGFDPFGGDARNPSWEIARTLQGETIGGHRVESAQLPTAFARAPRVLRAAIRQHRPALVLCIGLASVRNALSLERIAINTIDARIADNDGAQPIDVPVMRGGPAAYFTTLPIKAMHAALASADIPAEISQTAGTFVCNQVFYVLMRSLARMPAPRPRGGFVHVPSMRDPAANNDGGPGLPLETMVSGLRIAIACALSTRKDRRIAGGAID